MALSMAILSLEIVVVILAWEVAEQALDVQNSMQLFMILGILVLLLGALVATLSSYQRRSTTKK